MNLKQTSNPMVLGNAGPTTLKADIPDYAEITIGQGSLVLKGNIGNNVTIKCTAAPSRTNGIVNYSDSSYVIIGSMKVTGDNKQRSGYVEVHGKIGNNCKIYCEGTFECKDEIGDNFELNGKAFKKADTPKTEPFKTYVHYSHISVGGGHAQATSYVTTNGDVHNSVKSFSNNRVLTNEEEHLRALVAAINQQDVESMQEMVSAHPQLLEVNFNGKYQIVKPSRTTYDSYTLLGYAALLCKPEAVKWLIDNCGLNPNEPAVNGLPPLMHLILADDAGYDPDSPAYQTAKVLLERKADPNKEIPGVTETPREYAESNAPSIVGLAWHGMRDKSLGANCRAQFEKKDTLPVTFAYQIQRNAVPLAVAYVGYVAHLMRKMK